MLLILSSEPLLITATVYRISGYHSGYPARKIWFFFYVPDVIDPELGAVIDDWDGVPDIRPLFRISGHTSQIIFANVPDVIDP